MGLSGLIRVVILRLSQLASRPIKKVPLRPAPIPSNLQHPPCANLCATSSAPNTVKMGVSRTKTVKSKHATKGSGIKNSKLAKRPESDPVVKAKRTKDGQKPAVKPSQLAKELQKKKRKKVYSQKELGIPELNMVTPVGVQKPKGKKKGKVFVDDRVRCAAWPFFEAPSHEL